MKNLIPLCIALLAWAATTATAADIAIVHAGRLLAVPGQEVLEEQSVVIRGGRISEVRSGYIGADSVQTGSADKVQVHDLKHMFVLPGLIDGHVHLTEELGPDRKRRYAERSNPDHALFAARNARLTLEAGFTTVRDVGAHGGDAIFALRDAIDNGYVIGPRVYASGSTISPTGGHGQEHGYREEIYAALKSPGICDGADACRQAVREQVRRSADHIKLVATGGVLSETAAGTGQQFFSDELEAIMDTAHALGRKVTAHAHGADGINAALEAGVDSIEHGTFANRESFRLFRRNGAYLVPTILAGVTVAEVAAEENSWLPQPIRHKALQVGPEILQMVRRAHAAGVKIAFGTDTGVSRHGDNAREFLLLVDAGLTPMEAIRSATVSGADNLGKSALMGSIEVGKYGDLVAVDGDPTVDISELLDVDFVMREGAVYKMTGE
jgi:imidazolonepropionase-like amidohydrolase